MCRHRKIWALARYDGHVAESSLYTKATLHPLITVALLFGSGLAFAALLRGGNGNGHRK